MQQTRRHWVVVSLRALNGREPTEEEIQNEIARRQKAFQTNPLSRTNDGVYSHPSFKKLHGEYGSGYFVFSERVGLGGIFYLCSRGVVPYSPSEQGPNTSYHDVYDVLRAVDNEAVYKLSRENLEQ